MLAVHSGPRTSDSLAKQVVVYCDGRQPEVYQWLLEQVQVCGARLHRSSFVEHDQNMAFIQALRLFVTFAYSRHLAEENVQLEQLLALIKCCAKALQCKATALLEHGDKQAFIDSFRKVEHWLVDHAQSFQNESRVLLRLRQINDNRQ